MEKQKLRIADVYEKETGWKLINNIGACPFCSHHPNKTGAFIINTIKNAGHCFSCGKTTGIMELVMHIKQLSETEAIHYVYKNYIKDKAFTVDEQITEFFDTHIDTYLTEDDGYIDLLWLFAEFKHTYKESFSTFQRTRVYATTSGFKKIVEKYCASNNFVLNPKKRLNQPKEAPTRIARRSVKRFDVEGLGKITEHIYIKKRKN